MSRPYRIVVGVDGSEGGARALRWAVREAAARGATVHAVTVWSWDAADAADAWYADQQRQAAERILGDAVARALNDNPYVTVTTDVVADRPGHALTAAARDADVLVLGSHGHSRLFHAVLGSVTEECIRTATCPVVVVPTPHQHADGTPSQEGLSSVNSG